MAAVRNGAQVNQDDQSTANTAQSVAIGARDDVTETIIAGALGAGTAGLGAGVDVNLMTNSVLAFIGASNVTARDTVSVNAASSRTISSDAIAVGVGALGLGGGIVVLSIGGGLTGGYSATNSDSNNTSRGNALTAASGNNADDDNSNVPQSLNTSISGALTSMTTPAATGTLPPVDPQSDIHNNTISFGQATNLATGDTITYSANGNQTIGGLTDGGTYFVIVTDSTHIELAASYNDAIAGDAITLDTAGASGSQLFMAGQNDIANSARSTASTAAPSNPANTTPLSGTVASGTTAAIDGGGVITANTVTVTADQQMQVTVPAGGGAFGGVAIGVGLAVVTLESNVSAYIGPAVQIEGQGGSGNLTVSANRDSTVTVPGVAGVFSGFGSIGAAVADVSDTSSVVAFLGADYNSDGVLEGSSTTNPMEVGGAGFASVSVTATQNATVDLSVGAAAISLGAGLGAAIVVADVATDTTALIGANAIVGATASGVTAPIGNVTISASGTQDVEPYSNGIPMAIALGGGFIGGAADIAEITIGLATTALVGAGATIAATGMVDVDATEVNPSNLSLDGASIGAMAIGVVISTVTATPAVTAKADDRSKIAGSSIAILANGTVDVTANATPAAGGILAGSGGVVTAEADPTTDATVGAGASLTATGAIDVGTIGSTTAQSTMSGGNLGGASVGVGKAFATVNAVETTDIGAASDPSDAGLAAVLEGGSLSVTSSGSDDAIANSTGSGG
jgi:hypothetical protein